MEVQDHPDNNHTYYGDKETGVCDLPCRVEGSYIYSYWRPTQTELDILNAGGVVQHHSIGHPIHPFGLEIVRPDLPLVDAPCHQPGERPE